MIAETPRERVTPVNARPLRPEGDHVLYWMIAQRRVRWNFGLQHAIWHATQLGVPLIVLEALRVGYPWASERLHRFVLDGMADNRRRLAATPIAHHAYVEPTAGAGSGLLAALAERAAVVVTDEFPCFFLPRMVQAAGRRLGARLEQVDSNGVLPLRSTPHEFPSAFAFRRFLQRQVAPHLAAMPIAEPLAFAAGLPRARVDADVLSRWPAVPDAVLDDRDGGWLATLQIDHRVAPAPMRGGAIAGEEVARTFLARRLGGYADGRNQPALEATSGLSPYLHFGHVSVHEVVHDLLVRERWHEGQLAPRATGSREGFWGVSRAAEAFLDELVTWREVGFAQSFHRADDYDRYESLPAWALQTLEQHATDPRPWRYDLDALARAETHDPLWNAAQTQLVREGRIHGYLRMLWGKKVLEWSVHPRDALAALVELNNRYALDGRDPSSYSGIFWCLGRFDRAWGPERPIFGKVRYMSSDNTARKVSVADYLRRYAPR